MTLCHRRSRARRIFFAATANAQIAFEEVTARSGISFSGRSMGAAWGTTTMTAGPTSIRAITTAWPACTSTIGMGRSPMSYPPNGRNPSSPDKHGAAWGDFDNDGDQDIMQMSGAEKGLVRARTCCWSLIPESCPTKRSSEASLIRSGEDARRCGWTGTTMVISICSSPIWLDRMDVRQAPIFNSPRDVFDLAGFSSFPTTNSLFAQASELRGDGRRMLIIHAEHYPQRIAAFGTDAAVDLRGQLNMPLTSDGSRCGNRRLQRRSASGFLSCDPGSEGVRGGSGEQQDAQELFPRRRGPSAA